MLLYIIRIFLVDNVARGKVFFHVLVLRERVSVNSGNAPVCGDFHRAAESAVVHKVDTVYIERIFDRNRYRVGIIGYVAVVINGSHNNRIALGFCDNRAVLGNRRDRRVARFKHDLGLIFEIRIERIFKSYGFGGEHRKRVGRAEVVFAAGFTYFAVVRNYSVVGLNRLITSNREFIYFGYGITVVALDFYFNRFAYRFAVGTFAFCRQNGFALADRKQSAVYYPCDVRVGNLVIESFEPTFGRINRKHVRHTQSFVKA